MVRVIVEFVLAAVFAILAVLTVVNPQWVETLFGVDPDHGSGALESAIVAVFGVLAVLAAGLGTRTAVARSRVAKA